MDKLDLDSERSNQDSHRNNILLDNLVEEESALGRIHQMKLEIDDMLQSVLNQLALRQNYIFQQLQVCREFQNFRLLCFEQH